MQLNEYLDALAGRNCAYGRVDCATLMADWLVCCGWPDAMPDRRGTYSTERAYRAALRDEGGLLASCRTRFGMIGLAEVNAPASGDVVIALAPFAFRNGRQLSRPVGAIAVDAGGLLALLAWPRGIVCAVLPVRAAWRMCRG